MFKASITAEGRIQFPRPMLKTMGIIRSTKMYIKVEGDSIVLTPVHKICSICHTQENMVEGFPICKECGSKIRDVMNLA